MHGAVILVLNNILCSAIKPEDSSNSLQYFFLTMPRKNNNSKSQYLLPGPFINQNKHTHTPTLGQSSTMSVDVRERSGHGAGRRRLGPTRTHDPGSSLMGGDGTEVDTGFSHGGVGTATDSNYGSVVAADQHQIMGSGSSYYLRDRQPRQLRRQLQGQIVQSKDVGADEVDGMGSAIHRALTWTTLIQHSRVMTRSAWIMEHPV